jgi:hypothetical protein
MNRLFRCRLGSRSMGRRHDWRRGTVGGIVLLLCAGYTLGWGQPSEAPKAVPPGVSPPTRPATLVELTIPADVKLALEGSKLTANQAKREVVTEGEATLRLANHILLKAHGARVTVTQPGHHRESRIVIEPMPSTVAER